MNYLSLVSRRTFQTAVDRFLLNFSKKGKYSAGQKKKVCLLRLDGLGDVVMFADAIRCYRELFDKKEYEISLITEDWVAPLFENCPYLSRVISCDTRRFKKDLAYRLRFLSDIKKSGYDVFINSCIQRELLYGDAMVYASGAGCRYGYSSLPQKVCERVIGDPFYTALVPRPEHIHEMEKNSVLVSLVAGENIRPRKPLMDWYGKPDKTGYFVVAPGAKDAVRRWPETRFASLCTILYEKLNLTPVIIGGKDDVRIADSIVKAVPGRVPIENEADKLDLPSVAGLISGADFFIGNDSGPAHLATALGTKTFVIAAGGNFTNCLSYPKYLGLDHFPIHQSDTSCFDCGGRCRYKIEGIFLCINNISVEQASETILKNLKDGRVQK
ncbi:MAG: glycosyltransferase family 9 protein [Nitrospiraceae bacterium]|nr:glycosyltransferase family 9 protein [Nitrospiraceae bacterium]